MECILLGIAFFPYRYTSFHPNEKLHKCIFKFLRYHLSLKREFFEFVFFFFSVKGKTFFSLLRRIFLVIPNHNTIYTPFHTNANMQFKFLTLRTNEKMYKKLKYDKYAIYQVIHFLIQYHLNEKILKYEIKINKDKHTVIKITQSDYITLKNFSEKYNIPMSEIINRLIYLYTNNIIKI